MKTRTFRASAVAVVALAAVGLPLVAQASSHREAPAISFDPGADNTDLYAWVTPGSHERLHIVANYVPLEEPSGGPNFHDFSDEVRYEIHITRGGPGLPDAATYYIFFSNAPAPTVDPADLNAPLGGGKEFFRQISGRTQSYRVTKVVNGRTTNIAQGLTVAPPNIGPRTQAVAFDGAPYDTAFTRRFIHDLGNNGSEGRIFAGPRDDGFYVDLGAVFDLANLRAVGDARDGVAGYNTHSIALEIPTRLLTADGQLPNANNGQIGVWAAASRRKMRIFRANGRTSQYGPWVQVSRLGLPLINEVVIGLQDKDKWNARYPGEDVRLFGSYFLNPVIVRDAEAVGIYQALGVPQATVDALKTSRLDIIGAISLLPTDQVAGDLDRIGDVLRVDMSRDSQFPNGRAIPGGAQANQEQVDVTDVLMTVVLAGGAIALGDNVNYNDRDMLAEFPWLPEPHSGYDSLHGRPTP